MTGFHVREGWPLIEWEKEEARADCWMVETAAARELASAVMGGKGHFGYGGGGSFLINEYGQVLVPSPAGTSEVVLVGEWTGPLEFENPFDGGVFDLMNDEGLQTGARWELPYVGIVHNLSKWDELYYWDKESSCKVFPPEQDERLIRSLRQMRPHGPVRFIVTPGAFALTKVPSWERAGWCRWIPRYVGRLKAPPLWFRKED
jgi:hypothetical protein